MLLVIYSMFMCRYESSVTLTATTRHLRLKSYPPISYTLFLDQLQRHFNQYKPYKPDS